MEANVGYLRRNVMVPPPVLREWTIANSAALAAATRLWSRPHYKKGLPIAELFESDREALTALPARPFRPVRFTRVRTDGYGKFRLDQVHWYSSAPEWAHTELVVEIGAFTVVPYTPQGQPITTHPRQYGSTRTDTVDPRTTLHRLSHNPGAFRNSPVRTLLSDALVSSLDHYAREDLRGCLKALADLTERFGFDHAQRALEEAVHAQQISHPDILVRGTRMACWESATELTIDLRQYDEALLGVLHAE